MAFPVELASVLTGASISQLRRWSSRGLIIPEVRPKRPMLYSFRDLVALRSVMWLRTETSLQRVRKALANLSAYDLTDHPSAYKFATDGRTISVWTDDGFMDLVQRPGQYEIHTLADFYRPFQNRAGEQVVDFERPMKYLRVNARRMGGWPTIEGTRVPYDSIASLLEGDEVTPAQVKRFYPAVSAAGARDAAAFGRLVEARRRSA